MKDKNCPDDKWLKKRGFEVSEQSNNKLYIDDCVSLCVDVSTYQGECKKDSFPVSCISLYDEVDYNFVHLDLHTKKQIKDLYKILTGKKLIKVRKK